MSIIVEVGAQRGAETFNFLMDSEADVYSFEPEVQYFIELFQKAKEYPRLTLLPMAVDIGDNQEPLFHYENGRSTLQPPMFGSNIASFTMTWTIRLDTFMHLYSLERIDYLRIDAPLREEMILESLGDRITNVERGRIRQYGEHSVIPAWLLDHGFNIEQDTTSNNLTEPDIRFWRK